MKIATYLPKSLSAKTAVFCALFLIVYQFLWGFSDTVISWDTYGYYLYLPQTIIHGDPGIENFNTVTDALSSTVDSGTFYQAMKSESGQWVIKYPMGLAVFYLPFFLIGMFVAWIGGFAMDGFSLPFQYAMTAGSMFYMLVGIWLMRKVLRHFFAENITAITLLIIVFGTNYFHMHTRSHCMPHVYLFTGYAALLWFTIRWYEKRTLKLALGIGFIIGLMTLSRVTELISILIPAVYGITSVPQVFQRIKGTIKWYRHILLIGLIIVFMMMPQLIYWKIFGGSWLYDSYKNSGEGLDFLTPYTQEFLFSYRKGWLKYTPVMILAIMGLIVGIKSRQKWAWSALTVSVVFIYVASSWTTWWYAASFSQRTMVQLYPVMALALGGFLYVFWQRKIMRVGALSFATLCIGLNLFQTWQYNEGIIDPTRMTKKYYWKVFGKTDIPEGAQKYLLVNRSMGPTEQMANPEDYELNSVLHLRVDNGFLVLASSEDQAKIEIVPQAFGPKFERAFENICGKDHCWITLTGRFEGDSLKNFDGLTVITTFDHGGIAYSYHYDPVMNYLVYNPEGYYDFQIRYLTPEVRSSKDPFQFYFYNTSQTETFEFSRAKAEIYQLKDRYD